MNRLRFGLARLANRALNRLAHLSKRLGSRRISTLLHSLRHRIVRGYLRTTVLRKFRFDPAIEPRSSPADGRVAWVLWWQGLQSAPPIVQMCIRSLSTNIVGYETKVLSGDDHAEYSDVSPLVTSRYRDGHMTLTHYSNFIRLSLLRRHGGVWIDATMFAPEPLVLPAAQDGLTTRRGSGVFGEENIARERWSTYLIGGPAGYRGWLFVEQFLTHYWQSHTALVDYHLFDHAIAIAYDYDSDFRAALDSLPVLSPDIHALSGLLNMPRAAVDLGNLLAENPISKLSWKTDTMTQPGQDPATVRDYLSGLI